MFWGFWLRGTWDLSPLTRDLNLYPCIGRQSLTHWTIKEVLEVLFLMEMYKQFSLSQHNAMKPFIFPSVFRITKRTETIGKRNTVMEPMGGTHVTRNALAVT